MQPNLIVNGCVCTTGHNGLLHEAGWQKYDSLQMLGWQAEWMAYEIALDDRLSAPALVVPVFDKAVVGSTATVQVPAQSVLQQYAGMEFGTYSVLFIAVLSVQCTFATVHSLYCGVRLTLLFCNTVNIVS